MSMEEEGQELNMRVFKWNEELHNLESSQGLFLYRMHDSRNSELDLCTLKLTALSVFELVSLSNQESIKELVSQAIKSREDLMDDENAKLREAVSRYLFDWFGFDIQTVSSQEEPTIVIVVDASPSKRTNCTRKRPLPSSFSSESQETEDSQDDVSTGSEFVKKRKVGNARAYKMAIRSRIQQKKLSDQDEAEIRDMIRLSLAEPIASWIMPTVTGEPDGRGCSESE